MQVTEKMVQDTLKKYPQSKQALKELFPEQWIREEKVVKRYEISSSMSCCDDNLSFKNIFHSFQPGDTVEIYDNSYICDFKFNKTSHPFSGLIPPKATVLTINENIYVKWKNHLVPLSISVRLESGEVIYVAPFCIRHIV